MSVFPAGRERLVHDLVASSVLHRLVDAGKAAKPALAEAFYLLGVIEARSIDSYWVSQTELHLEAAIRLDPGGRFAEPAYALLEEYTVVGYGGSSGVHLPKDVRSKLEELGDLVETGPGAARARP